MARGPRHGETASHLLLAVAGALAIYGDTRTVPLGGRAAYGKRILATVSRELTAEFGAGFSYATVNRAIQFAQFFPNPAIVSTLSTQLSWSHFIELLPIKDPLARDFYAKMCRIEHWDVRTLRQKIGGMLFQRTALSKKPQAVISTEIDKLRDGRMSPDTVFRDPYLLDLLGLKGAYSERLDFTLDGFSTSVPLHNAGKVRIVASLGQERPAIMPANVQTFHEAGFPALFSYAEVGLMAPAGTPAAAISKLHAATVAALKTPAIVEAMQARGEVPTPSASPEEYAAFIRSETARWAAIIKPMNVQLD